jgi:4'-phosphopantetheinyl transferase
MPVEVTARWGLVSDLARRHRRWLDDTERERLSRLRRAEDRDRFVLGSTLVRALVAELDGVAPGQVRLDRRCARCGDQHGPVTLPGRGWSCSVTHSGPFAAVAVAPAPTRVGVDLEVACPPEWPDLLARVLAPGEVAPADGAEFLSRWVAKEALLKATHHGLTLPMTSVTVGHGGAARVGAEPPGWQVVGLDVQPLGAPSEAAAALAVDTGPGPPSVGWARADL